MTTRPALPTPCYGHLSQEMAEAAIKHYKVVNGEIRGKAELATNRERAAMDKLLKALGHSAMTETEWSNLF